MTEPITLLVVVVIGLAAGVVGGLAGIGGSIVMLPALGLLIGYDPANEGREHHLYMAAAMIVNAVVSGASLRRHLKAKAVRVDLWRWLLPGMGLGILGGVELSTRLGGNSAKLWLAVFLIAYCVYNALTAKRGKPENETADERGSWVVPLFAGLGVGVLAGFLGIGGGIVLVPILVLVVRAPTRQAIATSASVMAVTSVFGAAFKLYTLSAPEIMQDRWEAIVLAIPMSIGAFVGAPLGANLTHTLKLPHLKLVISAVLAIAGLRLAYGSLKTPPAAEIEATPGALTEPE
ncbi:MAG: sulfite exporter TauE/SafE family protein [Planctomycetota bacterium]